MAYYAYVDMDAFYVSCELVDRPELLDQSVIVGPDPRIHPGTRGVVLSASYPARATGVRSAMPVAQAVRLCPSATWIAPRFDHYSETSRRVRQSLSERWGRVLCHSIDEFCFSLDPQEIHRAGAVGREIQADLRSRFSLPSSIGLAPFRVVAKIASDRAKPNGVVAVAPESVRSFLQPLPVGSIPGVGPKTQAIFRSAGIVTIGQLAAGLPSALRNRLGVWSRELVQLANGTPSESEDLPEDGPKSRQVDRTFSRDVRSMSVLSEALEELGVELGSSLAKDRLRFQTVTLGLRWEDFIRTHRSHSLRWPREGIPVLLRETQRLLAGVWEEEQLGRKRAVRTLSVSAERLTPPITGQRNLDGFVPSLAFA